MEITRSQLVAAYTRWEIDLRANQGAFMSEEEVLAMTPQEFAEKTVSFLLGLID